VFLVPVFPVVLLLLVVVYGVAFLIVVVFLILDFGVPYPCLLPVFFFSPYRGLDALFAYPYPYPCLAWLLAKTSFGLGCALIDFCFFCVVLPLISSGVTPGLTTKPRSDSP
jgi:hypothetical protein